MLESADLGCRADLGSFIRICADLGKIRCYVVHVWSLVLCWWVRARPLRESLAVVPTTSR